MKSSKSWLREHSTDPYVKRAQKEGYRSRAAFKLLELNERDHLIKPGITVVDLGAAPGGWSQVARKLVGAKGKVIAVDVAELHALLEVTFIQGDCTDPSVLSQLNDILGHEKADLVLSDMAPNISGIEHADSARSLSLAEAALTVAKAVLRRGGVLLVKVFEGADTIELRRQLNACFNEVVTRKPKASRDRSREIYLLAKGYGNTRPDRVIE